MGLSSVMSVKMKLLSKDNKSSRLFTAESNSCKKKKILFSGLQV